MTGGLIFFLNNQYLVHYQGKMSALCTVEIHRCVTSPGTEKQDKKLAVNASMDDNDFVSSNFSTS